MAAPKGLMRLPAFARGLFAAIRDQQPMRRTVGEPSLFYPEVQYSDVYSIAFFFALIFVLRMLVQRYLADRLFRSYPQRMRYKIAENLFYSVYYTLAFAYFALVVNPQADWSTNLLSNDAPVMENLLYPFPPPISTQERLYYAQAFGFYLSATVFLIFVDIRRADFAEFLLHHLVTLFMVTGSMMYGYVRVGMIVLALHDTTDIFLYAAKFVHHLGYRGPDVVLFGIMAVFFYVTRLVMYSRIVFSVVVETISRLVSDPPFNRWAMFYDTYLIHYVVFALAMSMLLWLHCFWFGLILKLIYREVVLGIPASDTPDADEEPEKPEQPEQPEEPKAESTKEKKRSKKKN